MSVHLHDSLFRYQRAHWSALIRLSTSPHDDMDEMRTSRLQINREVVCSSDAWLHDLSSNSAVSFGHSSTHTCGVGQPCMGTNGSMHFSKLKNTRNGLPITSLSTPHLRPCESVGTSNRSKSPFLMAKKCRRFLWVAIILPSKIFDKSSAYRNSLRHPSTPKMQWKIVGKWRRYTIDFLMVR